MTIANRIKILRKDQKLTQEEFGTLLGITRDAVGNIEYDRLKRPEQKEPIYRLIIEKFQVSERWLRTGEGPMYAEKDLKAQISAFMGSLINGSEADEFKRRLIYSLSSLSESEWEALEKIARNMSKTTKEEQDH